MSIFSTIKNKITGVVRNEKATPAKNQYSSPIGPQQQSKSSSSSGGINQYVNKPMTSVKDINQNFNPKPKQGSSSSGGSSSGGITQYTNQPMTSVDQILPQSSQDSGSLTTNTGYNPATKSNLPTSQSTQKTNVSLQETNPLWNYQLNKPYGTLTPASNSFSNFQPNTPYLRRRLNFYEEKAKGWVTSSNLSPFKGNSYQAESIGKLVPLVETGAYFIPVVGTGLLVGLGAETILTKKGRSSVSIKSSNLQKEYGIPSYVSTPAQYGLAGASVVFGGSKFVGDVEKIAGLPKINTNIVGYTQNVQENKVVTDVVFKSDVKKLLGTKSYLGVARSSTNILPSSTEGINLGETITLGSFGQKAMKIPTGKIDLLNVKEFNVIQGSLNKFDTNIPVKVASNKMASIYGTLDEGSISLFAGKGSVGSSLYGGRGIKFPTGKVFETTPKLNKFNYIGYGFSGTSGEASNLIKFGGKTFSIKEGELLTRGRGTFRGVLKQTEPGISFEVVGGSGGMKANFPSNLKQIEVQKTSSAISSSVGASQEFSLPRLIVPQIKTTAQTFSSSQINIPVKQTTKQSSNLASSFGSLTSQVQPISFSMGSSQLPTTSTRTGQRTSTSQISIPKVETSLASSLGLASVQVSSQSSITRQLTPNIPITPIIPFGGSGFPIAPLFPSFDFDNLGARRYKGKQRKKYTPSFEALVFKIKGKAPKGLETGARVRPITPGYSWAFNKPSFNFGKFGSSLSNTKIKPFRLKAVRRKRR